MTSLSCLWGARGPAAFCRHTFPESGAPACFPRPYYSTAFVEMQQLNSKNFVEMTKQVARLAAHPKTAANGGQNLWRTAAKAGQNALKKGRFLPIMDTAEHRSLIHSCLLLHPGPGHRLLDLLRCVSGRGRGHLAVDGLRQLEEAPRGDRNSRRRQDFLSSAF